MAKKILVIDDDPVIVKYLVSLFADNGYDTCSAGGGLEGNDPAHAGEWGPHPKTHATSSNTAPQQLIEFQFRRGRVAHRARRIEKSGARALFCRNGMPSAQFNPPAMGQDEFEHLK